MFVSSGIYLACWLYNEMLSQNYAACRLLCNWGDNREGMIARQLSIRGRTDGAPSSSFRVLSAECDSTTHSGSSRRCNGIPGGRGRPGPGET